jgi:profilin
MSSWQDYIDNNLLGSSCITGAAILQLDGVTIAASQDFAVSTEEVYSILDGMQDSALFYQRGVMINGVLHVPLSVTANIVRARNGTKGVCIYKTDKLLIVSTYDEPIKPIQAASVVEELGVFLRNQGY